MNDPAAPARHTPLHAQHVALGARMVDFAGWSMPLSYPTGILAEHHATRGAAGLFDVSHMGELHLRGAHALPLLQRICTNDVARLVPGQALYTVACNPAGGIVDDLIVYRLGPEHFLAVVNAARTEADLVWFRQVATESGLDTRALEDTLEDASARTALLALQGPRAEAILAGLTEAPVATLRPFHLLADVSVAGLPCSIARTGYTGEDGFELLCAWDDAPALFARLLPATTAVGGLPVGLGARDTLRLEARLPLYGQDLDTTTSPLEAGLGWVVKLDKGDFVGRAALAAQREAGPPRRLVGLVMQGRGIARPSYPIHAPAPGGGPDALVGRVTSGGPAPTLGKAVALGYVPAAWAAPGGQLFVDCRGKMTPAQVTAGPFYRRPPSPSNPTPSTLP